MIFIITKNSIKKFAQNCLGLLIDKKGEDGIIIDLDNKSSICDFFVLVSGNTDRHVIAMADHLIEEMKKNGRRPFHVQGLEYGTWVIVDYGDVVVHIFKKDIRRFYDLERIWRECKIIRIKEDK